MKLIFFGASIDTEHREMEVENKGTILKISIENTASPYDFNYQFIDLDRATAIKLVKVLKQEIGKMEVTNG